MANWAELDDNNIVIRVVYKPNDLPNEGYDDLIEKLGGRWVKTSYTTIAGCRTYAGGGDGETGGGFRKNYAKIGYRYDEDLDGFIAPQPFPSWILNEDTGHWHAPAEVPADNKPYWWNEEELRWEEKNIL
jgi:hypothetical protein